MPGLGLVSLRASGEGSPATWLCVAATSWRFGPSARCGWEVLAQVTETLSWKEAAKRQQPLRRCHERPGEKITEIITKSVVLRKGVRVTGRRKGQSTS